MEGQAPEPTLGSGPPSGIRDPSRLRVSDDDRHRVAEVLRQAAGDGRIDLAELDERLEAAYQAKTYGELMPITADLPVAGGAQPRPVTRPSLPAPVGSGPHYTSSIAVMSQSRRTGSWVLEDGHTAFALMGSVLLDLREAQFVTGEVTITASAVMGDVTVIVNAGTTVVMQGTGVMGDFTELGAKVPFDRELGGPVVRIRGLALMGSVSVQRKGRPGQVGKRFGLPRS